MRLTKLWIDGFRNLNDVTIEFDPGSLTTVILGQNGTGKSYLLEAIVRIFRNADLDIPPPEFSFDLEYSIGNLKIILSNRNKSWLYKRNGKTISKSEFNISKSEILPDMVFAYYSGTNDRMEALFDTHQQNYYQKLVSDISESEFKVANIEDRRLFYARPIHGVLALLSLLTNDDPKIAALLKDMLGISGFHSAMLLLRKPWFAKGKSGGDVAQFWGAGGRPGRAARIARKHAFFPMELNARASDNYRSKGKNEHQYAIYLRNAKALKSLAANFQDDLELFEELESIDISDLYRWVQVWISREDSNGGEVSYGELSEGERQLLSVLGLLRLSRNKRTLFLLDEPDTHLNPRWQYDYLDLIQKWAAMSADRCHLLLTTHSPLMIGSLRKNQVRVLSKNKSDKIDAHEPDDDPIGIGVEGLLKSELFGLRSTLAPEILVMIDRHYRLLGKINPSKEESSELKALAVNLNSLGISQTHPNPYYEQFARALAKRKVKPSKDLSPEDIEDQEKIADEILDEILADEKTAVVSKTVGSMIGDLEAAMTVVKKPDEPQAEEGEQ